MRLDSWRPKEIAKDDPSVKLGSGGTYGEGQRTELGGWLPSVDVESRLLEPQFAPIVIQGVIDERQDGLDQPSIWSQINPESKKLVAASNSLSEAYTYGDTRNLNVGIVGQAMYMLSPVGLEAQIKLAKEKYEETKNPLFYAAFLSAGFSRSLQLGVVTGIISMAQIPYWAEGYARILTKDATLSPLGVASVVYKSIATPLSIIGTQMIPGIINETLENPGAGAGSLASIYFSHKVMSKGKGILAAEAGETTFGFAKGALQDQLYSIFNKRELGNLDKWGNIIPGRKQLNAVPRAEALAKTVTEYTAERNRIFAQIESITDFKTKIDTYNKIAPDWFKVAEQNVYNAKEKLGATKQNAAFAKEQVWNIDRTNLDLSNTKYQQLAINNPHLTVAEALRYNKIKIEAFDPGKAKTITHETLIALEEKLNGKGTDMIDRWAYRIDDAHPSGSGGPEHIIIMKDGAGNLVPRRLKEVLDLTESYDINADLQLKYSSGIVNGRLGYNAEMVALTPENLAKLDISYGGTGNGKALALAAKDKTILRNLGERGNIAKIMQDNSAKFVQGIIDDLEFENNHIVRSRLLEQLPETTQAEKAFKTKAISAEIELFEEGMEPTRMAKANGLLQDNYNFWFKTSKPSQWKYLKSQMVPEFVEHLNLLRQEPHLLQFLATEFFQHVVYDRAAAGRKYTNSMRRLASSVDKPWETSRLTYFAEANPGLLDWLIQGFDDPLYARNIQFKDALRGFYENNLNPRSISTKDNAYAKVVSGYEQIFDPKTGKKITVPTAANPLEKYNFGRIAKKISDDWDAKHPSQINGVLQVKPKLPAEYWLFSGLDYMFNANKINPALSWATSPALYLNAATFGALWAVNKLGWLRTGLLAVAGDNVMRQRFIDDNKGPATYLDIFAGFYTNTAYQRSGFNDWLNKLGFPTVSNTGLDTPETIGKPSQGNAAADMHDWKNAWDAKLNPVYYAHTNNEIPDMYAIMRTSATVMTDEKGYTISFSPSLTFLDQRWSVSQGVTAASAMTANTAAAQLALDIKEARAAEITGILNRPDSQRNISYAFGTANNNPQGTTHREIGRLTVGNNVRGTVTRVVDGDTMEVALDNGETIKIRVLGVDTPEIHLAKNQPSRFNGESKTFLYHQALTGAAYTHTTLIGKRVELRMDPLNKAQDMYGRTLAAVWYGSNFDHDLTADLIENGFARVSPYAVKDTPKYTLLQTYAQEHKRGIWANYIMPVNEASTAEQNTQIFVTALDYTKTYFLQGLEVAIKNPGVM